MNQNEKYEAIIVGICSDAARLADALEKFQELFSCYAEELMKALEPVAKAFANPFGIEEPYLSSETIESQIMAVEDETRDSNTPIEKFGIKAHRQSQRVQMHYNYIPRTVRNQPYQRRVY